MATHPGQTQPSSTNDDRNDVSANEPAKPKNAGSGDFNQGAEDDPAMDEGVTDGTPNPDKVSREKENPKSGKVG